MRVKEFDQLGEIGERSGQPVDLVDNDDFGLARPDVREKLLQGRAIKGGAGKRAIIIALVDRAPSFVRLAFDIGLASLALGVEGIELKVQVMFGGFSRVNRAAEKLFARFIHGLNLGWRRPSRLAGPRSGCALAISPPAVAMALVLLPP
jgi:hypothetical protein